MNRLTKALLLVIALWSTSALIGCTNSNIDKQLSMVDSLLASDKLDDASKTLHQVKGMQMNERELTKYNFLFILTEWRLNQPISQESDLDRSIAYYEQHDEDGLLARCYYLKGRLLSDRGKVKEGVLLLKKAEQSVAKEDVSTQHHIYESLAIYNMHNESLALAIQYAQKALSIARMVHKPDWEGYEYYLLTLSYNGLGKVNEAQSNIQRLLGVLPKMSYQGKMDVLEILGQYYQKQNPQLMEQLMHKAMKQQDDITPYLYIATRYYNQGRKADAYHLLEQAEAMKRGENAYALIEVKRDMKMQDADYKAANLLSMRLVYLQDSILKADKSKDLENVQSRFEQHLRAEKQQRVYTQILLAIIVLTFSIITLMLYLRYRVYKMNSILSQDRLKISLLSRQIADAKQNLAHTDAQRIKQEVRIKTLTQEMVQIEERHNGLLADGHRCYNDILNGNTIAMWKKYHFQAFVEYYKIVDTHYLDELETAYHSLTDKNKLILILQHLGLSQAAIAQRLGISEGAIRTALSRIQKKQSQI